LLIDTLETSRRVDSECETGKVMSGGALVLGTTGVSERLRQSEGTITERRTVGSNVRRGAR
jgi:hypothetical protein